MGSVQSIKYDLRSIFRKVKGNLDMPEEELRTIFNRTNILQCLGYTSVGKDIRLERKVKGRRGDIVCLDDYGNAIFVMEFKKPTEKKLREHFPQLWDRYVKPLRARYGILINGFELILFKRIDGNYDRVMKVNLEEISEDECKIILDNLQKPKYNMTKIDEVVKYFSFFQASESKVNLISDAAQEHFFNNFDIKEDSIFVELLHRTINLFDYEYGKSRFLTSAYDFWQRSYAKEPERVPESWKKILKKVSLGTSKEDLFKFMFCLETAYALFTRLILAKACEDYEFPGIEFSGFIEREIKTTSFRGDIPRVGWVILTMNLIEDMKLKLVESVFEEDIFYWWNDRFRSLERSDLYGQALDPSMMLFGDSIAKMLLTLYKFDFSEIVGDPLGTLYQRYFDKETRKALGEFYTPKEVVEYIVDAVDYKGRSIIEKRLLDPACGSGTFLVEALKRYLIEAKPIADEEGWDSILRKLCNEYHIVGFDIHPFATIMAQIQFMLVLIPKYKEAMEENKNFVLKRLPIFRTDSLMDESKTKAMSLDMYEGGIQKVTVKTTLPVRGEEEGKFIDVDIVLPFKDEAISEKTGLYNIPEYFSSLQAIFDTVKDLARHRRYVLDKNTLKTNFMLYLRDKDWEKLVTFFEPYAREFLKTVEKLKTEFDDGRLVKSLEDILLAALLKNHVQYDFVVGNPPYVRKELISPEYKKRVLERGYEVYHGDNDLFVYFMEAGIRWLEENGKFSFITSNKFMKTRYGKKIRNYVLDKTFIEQLIDFGDTKVFADAINYPSIFVFSNKAGKNQRINTVIVNLEKSSDIELLDHIKSNIDEKLYLDDYISVFKLDQKNLAEDVWKLIPEEFYGILGRISQTSRPLKDISRVYYGIKTGINKVMMVSEEKATALNLERDLLRPILGGEDIKKYSIIDRNKCLIFPYVKDKGRYKAIKLDEYPNLKNYLTQYKDILSNRYDIKNSDVEWYELRPCDYYDVFDSPKVITPDISDKNNFSFDDGRYFVLNTAFVITLEEEYKNRIKFIIGLLNSSLLEFSFKQISTHIRGGYYRYITQYLERLPTKLPQNKKEEKLASQITENVNLTLEKVKLEQKTKKFPDEYIKEYRSRGEEFDSISITFRSGYKEFDPTIEETVTGREYNVMIGTKEKRIIVDSMEKARFVELALKGKRVKKDDKIKLLVPKSIGVVNEILTQWERDKEKVESEPTISTLENGINEYVYKLYGLNDGDRKVIEEFLEKF